MAVDPITEHRAALEARSYYPARPHAPNIDIIVTDATHREGATCAAAVVHNGKVVATDVFSAGSSTRAEQHGLALAARYAHERGIVRATFICDNEGIVHDLCGGRVRGSIKPDRPWLRLFAERPGWDLQHAPRALTREAHRAAAQAYAARYPGPRAK